MGSEKVPTPIVDRNGKQTTVHRNAVPQPPSGRTAGVTTPPALRPPRTIVDDQMELAMLAADTRNHFGQTASSFEFEVNDYGGFTINRVIGSDGRNLWDKDSHGVSLNTRDMEYNLRHVGFEKLRLVL